MDVMPEPPDLRGRVLVEGDAEAEVLPLTAPLSFWGGVNAQTGEIVDPRHPECGATLTGRVVVIPATVGSSSSSSILLELLRNGCGPSALLLGETDPILPLGAVVARELGYEPCPIVSLDTATMRTASQAKRLRVRRDGGIVVFA